MQRFIPGNTLRLSSTFTPPTELTVEPDATFIAIKPDTTEVTIAATKLTDGSYYADYVFIDEGTWSIRFELSGSLIQAAELKFYIALSPFV
jgi:hypothetical protein